MQHLRANCCAKSAPQVHDQIIVNPETPKRHRLRTQLGHKQPHTSRQLVRVGTAHQLHRLLHCARPQHNAAIHVNGGDLTRLPNTGLTDSNHVDSKTSAFAHQPARHRARQHTKFVDHHHQVRQSRQVRSPHTRAQFSIAANTTTNPSLMERSGATIDQLHQRSSAGI